MRLQNKVLDPLALCFGIKSTYCIMCIGCVSANPRAFKRGLFPLKDGEKCTEQTLLELSLATSESSHLLRCLWIVLRLASGVIYIV